MSELVGIVAFAVGAVALAFLGLVKMRYRETKQKYPNTPDGHGQWAINAFGNTLLWLIFGVPILAIVLLGLIGAFG